MDQFSSVQSLSHVQQFGTPWTFSTLGFPVHHQLLELAQTHVHQIGDAIQPSHLDKGVANHFSILALRIP